VPAIAFTQRLRARLLLAQRGRQPPAQAGRHAGDPVLQGDIEPVQALQRPAQRSGRLRRGAQLDQARQRRREPPAPPVVVFLALDLVGRGLDRMGQAGGDDQQPHPAAVLGGQRQPEAQIDRDEGHVITDAVDDLAELGLRPGQARELTVGTVEHMPGDHQCKAGHHPAGVLVVEVRPAGEQAAGHAGERHPVRLHPQPRKSQRQARGHRMDQMEIGELLDVDIALHRFLRVQTVRPCSRSRC
jgi:hypothetical protein